MDALADRLLVLFTSKEPFSVAEAMVAMQESGIKGFKSKQCAYLTIGLVWLIGRVFRSDFKDSIEDWAWLHKCSPGLRKKLRRLGLLDFGVAISTRDLMRAKLGDRRWDLSDLVCCVCLKSG